MKVFVTIPRVVDGVPITFGTLTDRTISGERLIRAYPEYSWHENQGKNCEGITSVYRVAVSFEFLIFCNIFSILFNFLII